MVFNLSAIHDVNTGIILTTFFIAYLKNRTGVHSILGLFALLVFLISILPTPLHGTGLLGIAALITAYAYLYLTWGVNREASLLILTSIIFMMLNVILGFKLRGIF